MGIVAVCPHGHRIKVKDEYAGRKGICPTCSATFRIPTLKTAAARRPKRKPAQAPPAALAAGVPAARVVSLDPHLAASLPAAFAVKEGLGDGSAAGVFAPTDTQPDFTPVADDAVAAPAATRSSATHAALGERPDLAWCVAVRGGAPSAPLDATAMRGWLDSGAATGDHVVWRTDWPDWRPLGDVFPEALTPKPPDWP